MKYPADQRFRLSPEAIAQQVNDETVIMDLGSEQYFGLNDTGTRIWRLIEREATVGEIVDALVSSFDVPRSRLESDCDAILTELDSAGLILPREEP